MDGEFRVEIKDYDAAKIIQAFNDHYTGNLASAYSRSAYQDSGTLTPSSLRQWFAYAIKKVCITKLLINFRHKSYSPDADPLYLDLRF